MARASIRIHFVLDPRATRWADIDALDESDVARAPQRFVGGRNSWIAQSFLRLRGAIASHGWNATAGPGFPAGAICIAHRDDVNRFASGAHASYLVVVRADRAPVEACDLAIVQNGLGPERHERFVPLWPQPGLLARDAQRGPRIERLAYHGRTSSMPPWFADPEFHRLLARRGVVLQVKARGWEDYRDVDLALAARSDCHRVLADKPATKLYNAWIAGVPMLASPEPAYCELRRVPLDFIEVHGPADVLESIDLLRANPRLYRAMVDNGRARGASFDIDATRERWMRLLEEDVVPAYHAAGVAARRVWFMCAMARQKARSRMYRLRCGAETLLAAAAYPSARPTTSATLLESPSTARMASSAARAWAWRPASYFFQRSNARARREAT
jgi:hypothetical protein